MYALATGTCTIRRGTSLNVFGDDVDNGTIVASGVLVSISEDSHTVWDSATQTPRVIRRLNGFAQSDSDIRSGDQLYDETNNILYTVQAATQPGGPGWTSDLELDLKRITPAE